MKKIFHLLPYILLGILFFGGVYYVMAKQGEAISTSTQVIQEKNQEQVVPPPPPPFYDTAALQQKLNTITASYPSLASAVSIKAINEDEASSVQSDTEYIAASTTKVIVATYALHQVEQGVIRLDNYISGTSLDQLITKMIVNSDNASWYTLLEHFGYSKITQYANSNGAPSFDAVENVITPNDMSQFVNNMHSGNLINQEHTSYLEGLMKQAYTGPIKLNPEFASIIRKAGWLEDRAHLTGVLIVDDKAVSYAIYTKKVPGVNYTYSASSGLINEVLTTVTAALQ